VTNFKYVVVENGDNSPLIVNRNAIAGEWEAFDVINIRFRIKIFFMKFSFSAFLRSLKGNKKLSISKHSKDQNFLHNRLNKVTHSFQTA
jgi:hypothetical protein